MEKCWTAGIILGVIFCVAGLLFFFYGIYFWNAEPIILGIVLLIMGIIFIFILKIMCEQRCEDGSKIEPVSKEPKSSNTALRFISRADPWSRWNFRMIFGFYPSSKQTGLRETETRVINARLSLIHQNLCQNKEDLRQRIDDTSDRRDQGHICYILDKILQLENLLDKAVKIALEFNYPVDSDFLH